MAAHLLSSVAVPDRVAMRLRSGRVVAPQPSPTAPRRGEASSRRRAPVTAFCRRSTLGRPGAPRQRAVANCRARSSGFAAAAGPDAGAAGAGSNRSRIAAQVSGPRQRWPRGATDLQGASGCAAPWDGRRTAFHAPVATNARPSVQPVRPPRPQDVCPRNQGSAA